MSLVRQTSVPAPAAPTPSFVKRFDAPERSVGFGDGRLDIISIGRRQVGKGSFAPGWKWTPTPGVKSGGFTGVVLSGRAKVQTKGGESADLTPGAAPHKPPSETAWPARPLTPPQARTAHKPPH